ncbi:uncharacterized protein LOC121371839 [Gigantopelta aegis]|uniref:uncharacterized protein LOC121371839 n=1 Tax=Gigantopelta aegis TaxID=1735272 RepID=UPI001B88D6BE|nr:uncharacterized protein LOC121371839 [Gigantopelta aegis]XP_041353966.1 uncharacterized protein LOC121371839 [Gigantopelta aegis]XP_041353967.1 uncharacterized protein LOC121371839 [Gigantopelta aegis]
MAQPMDTSESLCETRAVDENANGLSWGIIEPDGLADIVHKGTCKLLLIDSRSFLEFNTSSIQQSVNVCCSKLVKRRLQQNKVHIRELLLQNCHMDVDDDSDVIVYDQCTEDPALFTEDNFVFVLLQKLSAAYKSVTFLKGGYLAFHAMHPSLCENKSTCSYKCAPLTSLSQPCLPVSNVGPTRILPFLYLGSQQDALSQEITQINGINYILNVSITCTKPPFIQDGHFLRIPVNDNYSEKLLPFFYQAFQFIDMVREANGCVMVHCLAGISRSPTLAIAYIMKHMNMSSDDAYRYVKEKRPTISPNFNFLGQLLEFEKQLKMENENAGSSGREKSRRSKPFVMDLQLCSPPSPGTKTVSKSFSFDSLSFDRSWSRELMSDSKNIFLTSRERKSCCDVGIDRDGDEDTTPSVMCVDVKSESVQFIKDEMVQTKEKKLFVKPPDSNSLSAKPSDALPSRPLTDGETFSLPPVDERLELPPDFLTAKVPYLETKVVKTEKKSSWHSESKTVKLETKTLNLNKHSFSLNLSPSSLTQQAVQSTSLTPSPSRQFILCGISNGSDTLVSKNKLKTLKELELPPKILHLSSPTSAMAKLNFHQSFTDTSSDKHNTVTDSASVEKHLKLSDSDTSSFKYTIDHNFDTQETDTGNTHVKKIPNVLVSDSKYTIGQSVEKHSELLNFPCTSLDKLNFTPCLASDESPVWPRPASTRQSTSSASSDSGILPDQISPVSVSSLSSCGSATMSVTASPIKTNYVPRRKKYESVVRSLSSPISETKPTDQSSPMSIGSSSSAGSGVQSPTASSSTAKVKLRSRENKAKRPIIRPNSIAFSTYPTFDLGTESQHSSDSGSISQDDSSEAYMLRNSKKSKQTHPEEDSGKPFRWGRYSEREVYKQITAAMESAMLRTKAYEESRKARSLDDILSSEHAVMSSDCIMFGKVPQHCGGVVMDPFPSPNAMFEHMPCRCRGSSDPYQSNSSISSSGSHSSLHGSHEIIQLTTLNHQPNNHHKIKGLPHR